MTKTAIFLGATRLATGLTLPSVPAVAQESSGDQIGYVIVYGNDPCPRSAGEVVVCARKPESERYRIPEAYRSVGSRQSRESWASRAKSFEYVGSTGIMSCSAVGPGGSTGCLKNMIDRAKAEAREAKGQAVPPPESAGGGY